MPLELQARNVVVRETSDPEVVVAEWDYDGLVTSTNRSFQVANIQVSRVRDGQITASRDYHNHFVLADVLGRLPALLVALAKTGPGGG
jgi:ketosteroid isomerase-like protein